MLVGLEPDTLGSVLVEKRGVVEAGALALLPQKVFVAEARMAHRSVTTSSWIALQELD